MEIDGDVSGHETITCPHCECNTRFLLAIEFAKPAAMPPPIPTYAKHGTQSAGQPVYRMKGRGKILEVYEDKLTITSEGMGAFLAGGVDALTGAKTIPFHSITAIQFKKAGAGNGYLQFTIPGGHEKQGAILGPLFGLFGNDNTFQYTNGFAGEGGNDTLALNVKNYIEGKVQKSRQSPIAAAPTSVADELTKFAALKAQGILSEDEFQAAKKRLLNS